MLRGYELYSYFDLQIWVIALGVLTPTGGQKLVLTPNNALGPVPEESGRVAFRWSNTAVVS